MSNILQLKTNQTPDTGIFDNSFTEPGEMDKMRKAIAKAVSKFFYDDLAVSANQAIDRIYDAEGGVIVLKVKISVSECVQTVLPKIADAFQRNFNDGEMLEIGMKIGAEVTENSRFYKGAINQITEIIGMSRGIGMSKQIVKEGINSVLDTFLRDK